MSFANYILMDAARMGTEISTAMELEKKNKCLYSGKSAEELWAVAPYLFAYDNSGEMKNWYLEFGWGHSWGVMMKSGVPFEELLRHCRKFMLVNTESGKELYFRFYDPRVLRIFLPTCSAQQLSEFFGPINYFAAEDEDPNFILKFSLHNHKLQIERLPREEHFPIPASTENSVVRTQNAATVKGESSPSIIPEKPQKSTPAKEMHTTEKSKKGKGWNSFFFDNE